MQFNKKIFLILCLFVLLLFFFFFIDLILGSVKIPLKNIFLILFRSPNQPIEWEIIINEIRLPRILTGIFAGAALSVSGLLMQTIFRNPLAGPYVLGISSGSSLGVAILILGVGGIYSISAMSFLGSWSVALAGIVGAGFVLFIILGVASRINDIMTILILGIMFGSGISAIVSILQYFSNAAVLKNYVIWTLGSISNISMSQLYIIAPLVLLGLIFSLLLSKVLNTLYLGEEYAKTLGVKIKLVRFIIFLITSVLTGLITAFCGPIGFIGIAIPHITRMILRTSNHYYLILGTILLGSVFMLVSDIISQIPGFDVIIPINSVTALIGIPVIIFIIIKNKKLNF